MLPTSKMECLAKDLSTVLDLGKPSPIAIVASKKYQRPARRKKRDEIMCDSTEKPCYRDSESHVESATSSADDGCVALTPGSSVHHSYTDVSTLTILATTPCKVQSSAMVSSYHTVASHPASVNAPTTPNTRNNVIISVIESDSFNENFGPVVGLCRDKSKRMAVDTASIATNAGRHASRRKKRRVRDKSSMCMDIWCDNGEVAGTSAAVHTQSKCRDVSSVSVGVPSTSHLTMASVVSSHILPTMTLHTASHAVPTMDCDECRKRINSMPSQAGKRKRAKKRRTHCHHASSASTTTGGASSLRGTSECSAVCYMETSQSVGPDGKSHSKLCSEENMMDMDIAVYDSADTSSVSEYDTDPGADTTDEARDGDDEGSDENEVGDTYGVPMIPWWKLSVNQDLDEKPPGTENYCLGVPTVTREILAGKRRLKSRGKPHFHQLNEKIKQFLNDSTKQDLWLESTRKEERDHVRLLARLYCIGIRYEGSLKNICVLTKTRSTKLNVKEILQ